MSKKKKVAIFIMPRSSRAWEGAEALWITVAGWAVAYEKKYGKAIVVTSDRISKPEEVWNYPLVKARNKYKTKRKWHFIPSFLKVLLDDLLIFKSIANWDILKELPYERGEVSFVWEKHDLFFGPGRKLADKYDVPLISYVHAPVVWEAAKWGVKRYMWGKWLERLESKSLKKADVVSVVSEEVKIKLLDMGVQETKIIVSPMAVNPTLFSENLNKKKEIRDTLGLKYKFIIGWTGSFRNFHGLDHVIKAFFSFQKQFPEGILLLIGDGAEKRSSEQLARELGIEEKVIFTGRKPFSEIPFFLSLFDVAVVSARTAEGFHYSPLKLREYLAAGKAVLAPNAGEIPFCYQNEKHLKLFTAGDIVDLEKGLIYYRKNEKERQKIALHGKKLTLRSNTWEKELERVLGKIQTDRKI